MASVRSTRVFAVIAWSFGEMFEGSMEPSSRECDCGFRLSSSNELMMISRVGELSAS